ncbi:MAG: hypothetical protein KIH62_002655 [Candidatus Kerfeldbacteria bacterium]|nr:hypothetical protein [Candidatus Kerfeldbacteria bacterium]
MLSIALIHATIVSSLLHGSIDIGYRASYYPVATQVDTVFEWRLHSSAQPEIQALAPRAKDLDRGPELNARTAVVIDEASGAVLWQLNPDHIQAIASTTKLMTALVWLEHQPDGGFFAQHTFDENDDAPEGKELDLPMGETMTIYNIWRSTLVGSDNDTALALAHSSTLSHEQFVAAMNQKARSMGVARTRFVDPTGLSALNVSSAEDLARIARAAFSRSEVVEATTMTEHIQETVDTKFRTTVHTTNTLLFDREITVTAGKTGFIDEAGYCVVERIQVPGTQRNIIVVILGTETEADRFSEAKKLAQWAFTHFVWK